MLQNVIQLCSDNLAHLKQYCVVFLLVISSRYKKHKQISRNFY